MTWLVVGIMLAFIGLFIALATRGLPHTPDTLLAPVRGLLRQGFNGGFLIIHLGWTRKFIQMDKYIRAPGDYGIELAFPKANWSERYYDKLKQLCERDNASYRVSPAGPGDPLEFLFVDFGTDYHRAHAFVRKTLTEIFGLPKNVRLFCRLENATPEDRLLDR